MIKITIKNQTSTTRTKRPEIELTPLARGLVFPHASFTRISRPG
jgi:hypothetical protein